MCLPQEVVHELDAWSPLVPPPVWASSSGVYHWHPPVMDHARVKETNGDGEGSYYDPDLYTFFPGVSRRSANELPGSVFRSARTVSKVQTAQPVGSLAVMNPRKITRQTSYKGKMSRGVGKRSSSVGMYLGGGKGVKHDKTFNYIDMLRSLGEADSPPSTPPRTSPPRKSMQQRPPMRAAKSSGAVLQSVPAYLDEDDENSDSDDNDVEVGLLRSSMKRMGAVSPPPHTAVHKPPSRLEPVAISS